MARLLSQSLCNQRARRAGILSLLAWGALLSTSEAQGQDPNFARASHEWTVTRLDGDARIQMLQSPVFEFGNREIRATWALLWLDGDAKDFWAQERPTSLRVGAPAAVPSANTSPMAQTGFGDMLHRPELAPVRELYLEGPVEFFEDGRRIASADALYIDRIDGHGWLANARIHVREKIGGSRFVFKVQADWLRISADGSLRSDRARLTTCEHEVPHYYLRTDELRMTPTGDAEYPWQVSLQGNKLRIADALTLPLPPINYLADEDGEPALRNLRIGDSARYGPTIGLGYARELRGIGRGINRVLAGDPEKFKSKFRVDASYLGSRGLLLDLGLKMRSEGYYVLDTKVGLVPDSAEDRGMVRVDEDDRDTLRSWIRTRGRFNVAGNGWVDAVFNDQSDPGVQAEFFESEYLEFEERESYLHWRQVWGSNYFSASAAAAIDDWRTEVEELPELRYGRQRTTIGHLGKAPLVWGAEASAGWYRRQEGDPEFEAPFADAFGESQTWRAHTEHRLELPISVAGGAARLIPFAEISGTTWSRPADGGDDPARSALVVGTKLTASFWNRTAAGTLAEVVPTIGWSHDVGVEAGGGELLPIDEIEDSVEGTFIDLGLRARLRAAQVPFEVDAEIRTRRAADLADGSEAAWQPINVLASLSTRIGSVPISLVHDGRYDANVGGTNYARTRLSFKPMEALDVDAAFTVARDDSMDKLFEAASIGALYRFSPKWEFEGRQTLDLDDSKSLAARGIIRRYGHDLIVEFYVGRRSGEGGTSFGISLKPAITANRRPSILLPSGNFAN